MFILVLERGLNWVSLNDLLTLKVILEHFSLSTYFFLLGFSSLSWI